MSPVGQVCHRPGRDSTSVSPSLVAPKFSHLDQPCGAANAPRLCCSASLERPGSDDVPSLWAWGATMLPAILLTLSHDQPHRTEGEIITR